MKVPFVKANDDTWSYYKNPLGVHLRDRDDYEMFDLYEILEKIRSDEWKEKTQEVRKDPSLKSTRDGFYPTGVSKTYLIGSSQTYNGVVWFDIDRLDDPAITKEKLKEIPWIMSSFITTSGRGLKIIVKTDSSNLILNPEDADVYEKIANNVYQELRSLTGLTRDKMCNTLVSYICISHDPEIYINYKPLTFVNNI